MVKIKYFPGVSPLCAPVPISNGIATTLLHTRINCSCQFATATIAIATSETNLVIMQSKLQGKETSIMLGSGSYGYVKEVLVNGKVYAGKFFYAKLLESQNDGFDRMSRKMSQEFRLMSGLQHSNITRYVGECIITNQMYPVLLMERLERNLHDLLENSPKISWAMKHSILKDVSSGLLYLHNHGVVHRDLTATNVLLTSSMVAKITDFGNSLIIDLTLDQRLTAMPGTTVYMPPEALPSTGSCSYGPSLDIFSFGHLALFILIQNFPGVLEAPTFSDPVNPEKGLQARCEVERRAKYFDQLEKEISGRSQMKCVQLIKGCLDNNPSARPTTEQLVEEIQCTVVEDESSHATLLLEKLLLGKCNKKLLLVAGKRGAGKSDFTSSLTMFGRLMHSVNIVEYSPQREHISSLKKSAHLILFCTRMDGSFGIEDEQVITSLGKYYGNDFLRKTLIVLTMAHNVKPMGPQRTQYSDHSFLQTMKDESISVVLEKMNKCKLKYFHELNKRFVLAGAADMSRDGCMIPDVQSSDDSCRIDWIVPVAQTLLNLI